MLMERWFSMRTNWRPSSLRVLSQQLRTARATWRQRLQNAAAWWRPRWTALQRWASANRRPLVSAGLLALLFMALIAYDRPTWPPPLWRAPTADTAPGGNDPSPGPDAVWPRPGGPAGVPPDDNDPRVDLGEGAVEVAVTVPGSTADGTASGPALTAGGEQLLHPVDGAVIAAFGFRLSQPHGDFRFHPGVDIAAPFGTEVRAAFSGVVTAAGFHPDWGWHVQMDLGDGRYALYGNLDVVRVEAGQAVAQGTVIGTVGKSAPAEQTGASHLHFELGLDGEAIPPGL